ncbi:MAG TPA: hypothetical protein VLD86_10875, partial [Ilumatobacteraceae bacterium]|nr:hypothetical protein [Ilumatobacteraceae bacterium]
MSTFTPFEPSPGYGPAVSSGICSSEADVAFVDAPTVVDAVAVVDGEVASVAFVLDAVAAVEPTVLLELDDLRSDPHAATATANPVPANSFNSRR